MAKRRAPRNRIECIFECPAKGRVEVRIYPRKGELLTDTCIRALEMQVDKAQIPYCKKVRVRELR